CGGRAGAHEMEALEHAEAVLLVHDDKAQAREASVLFEQGLGADDQLRLCGGGAAAESGVLGAGDESDAVAGQAAAGVEIVLLRQDLGGRHQRHLPAVFDGDDGGFERDDGLARADVTLQQAAHGMATAEVGGDFFERLLLVAGWMKGEDALELVADAGVEGDGGSGLAAHAAALELEAGLKEEELFEDETAVA